MFVSPSAQNSGLTVGWLTHEELPPSVTYSVDRGETVTAKGNTTRYATGSYSSDFIHHCHLAAPPGASVTFTLEGQRFTARVPPAPPLNVERPVRIAVVGDVGLTSNSETTVGHMAQADADLALIVGDLSYADCAQSRWDAWGRLVQPLASQVPVLTIAGNHEVEGGCGSTMRRVGEEDIGAAFQAYVSRFRMPSSDTAGSAAPLYYSFSTGGVHIIMLASYRPLAAGSPQLKWLQAELAAVNRSLTPWLVAALHAPFYNSNDAHQGEHEPEVWRAVGEPLFHSAGVDFVFAGHVHACASARLTRLPLAPAPAAHTPGSLSLVH